MRPTSWDENHGLMYIKYAFQFVSSPDMAQDNFPLSKWIFISDMGFVPSKFYICCIILAQSKSFTTSIVKFALVVVFMCCKTYIFLAADVLKGSFYSILHLYLYVFFLTCKMLN